MLDSFGLILPYFPRSVQALILDSSVSDLMLNSSGAVFTDRNGSLTREEGIVVTSRRVQAAVENILSVLGGYISPDNPIQDSRLPDGARVAVVGPPCSPNGYTVTIRKFKQWFTLEELIHLETIPAAVAAELESLMLNKKNILISGGTSSGKTTLLNAFIQRIPASERLIVIEKPSELRLDRENVVRWEAIDALPGRAEVTVGHLLSAALRHRPDRIIVGEVRGSTAYDLLQALNTGHSGTFSTVHADNAVAALERISGLALSAHSNLNHSFVRSETANAIGLKTAQWRIERLDGLNSDGDEEEGKPVLETPASNAPALTETPKQQQANPIALKPAADVVMARGALLGRVLVQAIDQLRAAEGYGRSVGWDLGFGEEDVRAMASTLFIGCTR